VLDEVDGTSPLLWVLRDTLNLADCRRRIFGVMP
jgi:hypothetical protein